MAKDLLKELFEDRLLVEKIKRKLPYLFKLAELSVSRGGKIGMEVGVLREQIIIALLIHKFGYESVNTNIPTNQREIDVILRGHKHPISIKTKTGKGYSGVKLIWTVDWKQVEEFFANYFPKTDILFVNVVWDDVGVFAYIPLEVQIEVLSKLGKENYIKLPKKGSNPRGVEISSKALRMCIERSHKIPIEWKLEREPSYNPYRRWVELWEKE